MDLIEIEPTHLEDPPQVQASREQRASGCVQVYGEERSYWCRHCGREAQGISIPVGWYTLQRSASTHYNKPLRLGLYCSAQCLTDQMPKIQATELELSTNASVSA